jgi:hypothetical protein
MVPTGRPPGVPRAVRIRRCRLAGLILGKDSLSVHLTAARGWPLMARLVAIEETATERVFARDREWKGGGPPA